MLRVDGEELTLRQGKQEYGIPLAAVARVHARQRAVEVTLKAPEGTAPASHRVEGVSEAAAIAFADAVTALLPPAVEGAPAIDGAALVVTRAAEPESATPIETFWRRVKWILWGSVLAIVAMCVLVSFVAHPVLIVFALITGVIGFPFAGAVALLLPDHLDRWLLPRRGITVIADYAHGAVGPNGYLYGDLDGNTWKYVDRSGRLRIEVSYDPRNPGKAVRADGRGKWWEAFILGTAAAVALFFLFGFCALPFLGEELMGPTP